MTLIRESGAGDREAVEAVRRASWRAAYAGIIGPAHIERATSGPSRLSHPAPWRRTLVAVTDDDRAVVGYASYGPERSVPSAAPYAPAPNGAAASFPAARQPDGQGPGIPDPDVPGPDVPGPDVPDPDVPELTPGGLAREVGEIYAMYVAPDWWSTGTGRSLMAAALAALEADGYQRVVLWVLAANNRARRFYERSGFTTDGESTVLAGLGGVLEVRYARPLPVIP